MKNTSSFSRERLVPTDPWFLIPATILIVLLLFLFVCFIIALLSNMGVQSINMASEHVYALFDSKSKKELLTFLGLSMGGILLALQAVIAIRRAKAMEKGNDNIEQGQRQERLKNAIEHLGKESASVRMGGIYELFHLADDTDYLCQTGLDILCAHVWQITSEKEYREKYPSKPSEEIQSLLTLIFVRKYETFKNHRANLEGSWLIGADLNYARLEGADVSAGQLQGAHLEGAQLQKAHLEQAQLQGAYLQGTQLQGAHLKKAQLQGAHLEQAKLQGAYLQETQLQGAHLEKAQLQGAHLEQAQLQGAYLQEAQLQGAYLSEAWLQSANLEEAKLQNAYLLGARLQKANLSGARLQGAWLRSAKLHEVDLSKAKSYEAHLDYAQLQGNFQPVLTGLFSTVRSYKGPNFSWQSYKGLIFSI